MAKKRIKRNDRYSNTYNLGGWMNDVNNKIDSSSFGKAIGGSSGLGGITNAATSIVSGLINPSSNSTGVGNTLQGIGSMASNIPGIGGVIGAGVNLVGGLVNAAFGSNLNEEFIAQTEDKTKQQAGYISSAEDNASLLSDWASYTDMAHVKRSDVGSDGWFSNKAKNKTKALNRAIDEANLRAWHSLNNTASNVDTNNDFLAMSNYSAYGGPITMRYTGVMSPFGNTFGDGGIFIKPENRGKFTALKERTGKSSTWYKEHGTPEQKKMATFALNAAKWKHADGGSVKKADYDSWYKTVPTDRNDTTSYNLRRAYELAPYSELEAWRTSSPKDLKNGKNHLRSVYLNPETGIYEFMKSKNHPTLHFETEWYNSNDPEAIDFRKNYMLDTSGEYYRYIPRKKAFGGELNTQGGDFTNGLTYIDNGGSHEANPFEGVQMGIDPQGVPNLVEEGEVIFNDYVFSNRLKVPKAIRQKYKLRDNITFADAAKKLSKESEERPNDPISKRGLQVFMSALANGQEEVRIKNEGRQMNRYAKGGKLGKIYEGDGPDDNYMDFGTLASPISYEQLERMIDLGIDGSAIPLTGTSEEIDDAITRAAKKGATTGDKSNLSYLRFAPAFMSGISAFTDLFSKPDYSAANRIASVDIQPALVSADPIGQYLSYKPLDRMFYINQLNKNTAAGRRAIQNTSGGNRAAALAGILAADYNYGENLGKLARQAEEYNQTQREKIADFNRQTDMFNSKQSMQAQSVNAQSRNDATKMRLAQAEEVAKLRSAAKNAYDTRRSNNLNNFINNLGNIGWEDYQREWINSNPALYYNLSGIGRVGYKGNGKKNGGKLKKKGGTTYA